MVKTLKMNDATRPSFKFGFFEAQATQSILDQHAGNGNRAPWKRIPIPNSVHMARRISLWLLATETKDRSAMTTAISIAARMALWVPSSIVVFFGIFAMQGKKRNDIEEKRYDEFKFDHAGLVSTRPPRSLDRIQIGRLLRPRYLCLADKEPEDRIISVLEWERIHGPEASLEYLFIAYTAEQFSSDEDLDELHAIAAQAAKTAGVPAYWISCSCMPDDERYHTLPDQAVDLAGDLYRISDVVRGSHSLVIIVGSPDNSATSASTENLLGEWGRRMWTFPEVVLSPSHKEITIYRRGGDPDNPLRVRKALFPRIAWADASDSQQLIDHYEGLQPLGYLQLVTLGLKCLAARKTIAYFPGDMVYALQGLLWCRPEVNPKDTAFQAFCRLSLANDSNHLLERLICLSPPDRESAWHTLDDFWNCKLWNINTSCQVVEIAGDDSVILSGAFGCLIRWGSVPQLALIKPSASTSRELSASSLCFFLFAMMGLMVAFSNAIALLCIQMLGGSGSLPSRICSFTVGGSFAAFVVFCFPLPCLLYSDTKEIQAEAKISSPVRRIQPHLIGFEGYLDLKAIEITLFGFNTGHLRWSVGCSNLSRSREFGERSQNVIGIDPYTSDPEIKNLIQQNIEPGPSVGKPRIFTLIDTHNMTVTLFQAVYPPVAMLLCGTEGGFQRALLCSYDQDSRCLYRETVLRVPSTTVEKMHRIERFRLGLKRPKVD